MAKLPLSLAFLMIGLLGLAGCSHSEPSTSTPTPTAATNSQLSILEQQAKLFEELTEQQAMLEATAEAVGYEIMLKATADASEVIDGNTLNQFLDIEVGLPFLHLTDPQIDCVTDQLGHGSIQRLMRDSETRGRSAFGTDTMIQFTKAAEKCVNIKRLLLDYAQSHFGPLTSECVSDKTEHVIFHELLIAEFAARPDGTFGTSGNHEMSLGGILFACAQSTE